MNEYCDKHPSVRLKTRRENGVWVGMYCPLCVTEEDNREIQQQLIDEQQRVREIMEERDAEKAKQFELKLLQDGLVEFDSGFQREWHTIAIRHKMLLKKANDMNHLIERLANEYEEKVNDESLPGEVISKVNSRHPIQTDELNELYEKIVMYSDKDLKGLQPGNSTYNLFKTINEIVSKQACSNKMFNQIGAGPIYFTVSAVLLGVIFSSVCNSGINVIKPSVIAIVFFWPAFISIVVYIIRKLIKASNISRNIQLLSAIRDFANMISKAVPNLIAREDTEPKRSQQTTDLTSIVIDDPLFEKAKQVVIHTQQGSVSIIQKRLRVGYSRAASLIDMLEQAGVVGPFQGSKARSVLITSESVGNVDAGATPCDTIQKAHRTLEEIIWNEYCYESISYSSNSAIGRKIHEIASCDEVYQNYDAFIEDYNNVDNYFDYMRNKIISIGEEISEGIRVPSRFKSKRIQLLRCPSCGGPLAKGESTKCHYCDAEFLRY